MARSVPGFRSLKKKGQKIVCLTAYDDRVGIAGEERHPAVVCRQTGNSTQVHDRVIEVVRGRHGLRPDGNGPEENQQRNHGSPETTMPQMRAQMSHPTTGNVTVPKAIYVPALRPGISTPGVRKVPVLAHACATDDTPRAYMART